MAAQARRRRSGRSPCQAFPYFRGDARRSRSSVRPHRQPEDPRQEPVYEPDLVVVLDASLFELEPVTKA